MDNPVKKWSNFSCENESLHEFCSDLWDLGGRVARWTSTPAVLEQIEWLKIHGFNLEGDRKTRNNVGAVFSVVDQVVAEKCQTGIAIVELGTTEVRLAIYSTRVRLFYSS